MFVPVWIIVANFVLIAVLLLWSLSRSSSGGDMLDRQRRDAPPAVADEHAVMTRPEVVDALQRGRKIEAIRHVRAATGLGLKAAKQLLERHAPR
ncbi:ribosomal protein L7/L12 [Aurantiacibacter sp. MUD11]|uniref:ribosomal protein L7/L12 n=1 Tax=Aurantiacibacter sp. MUD11 TaxID=3003265 RepID=UPI0022AA0411|nr:ribosomal protein L7/L12 [Aurantiacibacter sp. MUD11]WAT18004.1 ribosomal protein L7/L12 [Aurantiacibacter sp. MUD11]